MSNDVKVSIGGDISPLKNELSKIPNEIASMGKGLAGAIGIGFGIETIAGKIDSAAENIHNMGIEAKKTGASFDFTQRLEYAAKELGVDSDGIMNAFRKIKETTQSMNTDSKSATVMSQLGLAYEDIAGLNPEETFQKVTGALSGMKDQTEQNIVAQELFGKKWQDILPFLREYSALGEEAARSNMLFSDADLKAAEEYEKQKRALEIQEQKAMVGSGLMGLGTYLKGGVAASLNTETYKGIWNGANEIFGNSEYDQAVADDEANQRAKIRPEDTAETLKNIEDHVARIPGTEPATGGRV